MLKLLKTHDIFNNPEKDALQYFNRGHYFNYQLHLLQ